MTVQQTTAEEKAIAHAFVMARRDAGSLQAYPGEPPSDLSAAYRIQDAAIEQWGTPIGGWKVGRINPPLGDTNRLSGPIFEDRIIQAATADEAPTMKVFADGFAAAEAEFLLRIARAPDPGKARFTTDDAIALIDAIHIGIEIASSPFPGINLNGAAVTISDFGNNEGLVIGESVTPDLFGSLVELAINGERVGVGTAKAMLDGPFGAARFLLENLTSRGITLQPGEWISTGALTGVHPVQPGDRVEARFGDRRSVRCKIAAR